jgi:hypothetical protein
MTQQANKTRLQVWVFRSVSIILIVGTIITAMVFANEARKEVKYLCGNFAPGVLQKEVIRQLNTGSFLHYAEEATDSGTVIRVSSRLTLGLAKCDVYLNKNGEVLNTERS